VTIFSLVCLTVVLIIACQPGSSTNKDSGSATASTNAPATSAAPKPDSKAVADEVRALLAEHDKGLNEKNLDAIMGTFSTEPTTVVLGTGSEEKWQGPAEIRAAYTEMLKDYDPNTLQANCDWKTGGVSESGTMAWFAAICDAKDSLQGKQRDYKLNVTAAAEKQGGKWKFVSLHMSNAFEPPVTK